MKFRFLLLNSVFCAAGCSGLFGEFPEFATTDVGDNLEVDIGVDAGEPLEFDLALDIGPPAEVPVGEEFDLVLSLGQVLEMAGVEVHVSVSEGEFAAGGDIISASSNENGRVEFSLSIDEERSGLIFTATSDHEFFSQGSLSTDSFDLIGTRFQADLSVIFGSAGTIADGEDEATISIELFDEDGNGVAGVISELSASGEGNIFRVRSPW